jgi:perosamine synthetase
VNTGIQTQTAAPPARLVPLIEPRIEGNEWRYVKDCLDTGWVSSVGAYVDRFERMMAQQTGTRWAVATASGTAALHTALLVAGVQPGDEVLVSSLTFIAPANAIRYAGAWPIFIDAEAEYGQMDAAKVARFLEEECAWSEGERVNRATGRRVSAIIPVHILGHPVDLDAIMGVARQYGLRVIEDATESLGATYKGRPVGQVGDFGCFSFNGNKLITTGGGGMIVTNNDAWAARARYLTTQAKDDPIEYVHRQIGFNYRLTNVQAAMGCAQLEQIGSFIERKREIAARYATGLSHCPGITPMSEAPWASSAFWMYTLRIDPGRAGMGARQLLKALADQKIQCRPLWQPLHRSEAHAAAPRRVCEVADRLYEMGLSIPCSVGLDPCEQDRVIHGIRGLIQS